MTSLVTGGGATAEASRAVAPGTGGTAARTYAVAVVGAGPAGAVAAAALARAHVRVALIDRAPGPAIDFGECLPTSVRPLLERVGVWSEFRRSGHLPSLGIRSSWGSPRLADRDFLFSPYGCGWHVDRARFDRMLVDAAVAAGAVHLAGHALRKSERRTDGWQLMLSGPEGTASLQASFVVDASGRAAAFARRTAVLRLRVDGLVGIGGCFTAAEPAAEGVLLVEAVRDGWWYSAPLPGGKLAAVHMTDADGISRRGLSLPAGWWAALSATVHTRNRVAAHRGRLIGPLSTIAADSSRLERVGGRGWLAAGDAAAAFDPLSSRGLMVALAGGLEAARTARRWLGGDEDAVEVYADGLAREYGAYLLNRRTYYALEDRWPQAPFWRRRRGDGVSVRPRRAASVHSWDHSRAPRLTAWRRGA